MSKDSDSFARWSEELRSEGIDARILDYGPIPTTFRGVMRESWNIVPLRAKRIISGLGLGAVILAGGAAAVADGTEQAKLDAFANACTGSTEYDIPDMATRQQAYDAIGDEFAKNGKPRPADMQLAVSISGLNLFAEPNSVSSTKIVMRVEPNKGFVPVFDLPDGQTTLNGPTNCETKS